MTLGRPMALTAGHTGWMGRQFQVVSANGAVAIASFVINNYATVKKAIEPYPDSEIITGFVFQRSRQQCPCDWGSSSCRRCEADVRVQPLLFAFFYAMTFIGCYALMDKKVDFASVYYVLYSCYSHLFFSAVVLQTTVNLGINHFFIPYNYFFGMFFTIFVVNTVVCWSVLRSNARDPALITDPAIQPIHGDFAVNWNLWWCIGKVLLVLMPIVAFNVARYHVSDSLDQIFCVCFLLFSWGCMLVNQQVFYMHWGTFMIPFMPASVAVVASAAPATVTLTAPSSAPSGAPSGTAGGAASGTSSGAASGAAGGASTASTASAPTAPLTGKELLKKMIDDGFMLVRQHGHNAFLRSKNNRLFPMLLHKDITEDDLNDLVNDGYLTAAPSTVVVDKSSKRSSSPASPRGVTWSSGTNPSSGRNPSPRRLRSRNRP